MRVSLAVFTGQSDTVEKFRMPHRFALPSRVNFPSPRFGWTTFVFDSEVVVVHREILCVGPSGYRLVHSKNAV
jgi:hypothetical protein